MWYDSEREASTSSLVGANYSYRTMNEILVHGVVIGRNGRIMKGNFPNYKPRVRAEGSKLCYFITDIHLCSIQRICW